MALGIDPITAIANTVTTVIDKIFPDANQAAQAKLELARMQLRGDIDALASQLKINEVEAAHASIFVAGWRPWIGWVCGMSFAWCFLFSPMLVQISQFYGYEFPPVDLDINQMLTVLGGLLGLGGLRTFEKVKGVTK